MNLDMAQGDALPEAGPEAGRDVLIAVSDNGAGMTPALLVQAFEPPFTTKQVG